jgi:hypothetical protein
MVRFGTINSFLHPAPNNIILMAKRKTDFFII